ncbi:hypothetical protein BKA62DRAFT_245702 [Auriculariales sp. MPI-PUGE-AT-0066]|nr:hypothetical protein BKA62DRAFT_245702 [Auriculariales sp. MPI-PUGE-AT-0066]
MEFLTQTQVLAATLDEHTASYLRIASISIAAYDFLITLPAEWRFYSAQRRLTRPSLACILFIAIRYISFITIVLSNIGAFHSFSPQACERFYLVSPTFKAIQTIICQAILGVRTYAISKRNKMVGWTLLTLFFTCSIAVLVVNLYERVPVNGTGHCTSGNTDGHRIAWIHYVVSMFFDLITLVLSSHYLLGRDPVTYFSFSKLVRLMIYDGIGYWAILSGINIVNLIFYKTAPTDLQSAGASLGYAITWIMSQRILVNLHELSDASSRLRTPRAGVAPETSGSGHEMGIRVTITRETAREMGLDKTQGSRDGGGTPSVKNPELYDV